VGLLKKAKREIEYFAFISLFADKSKSYQSKKDLAFYYKGR